MIIISNNKYEMSVIVVIYILYQSYRYVFFSEKSKADHCTNLCTFIIDSKYEMPVIVVIYITIIDISISSI